MTDTSSRAPTIPFSDTDGLYPRETGKNKEGQANGCGKSLALLLTHSGGIRRMHPCINDRYISFNVDKGSMPRRLKLAN
jgi:hypothetical protein